MKIRIAWLLGMMVAVTLPISSQSATGPNAGSNATVEQMLDKLVAQEQSFLAALRTHTPLFETYIQESTGASLTADLRGPAASHPAASGAAYPTRDHYFLGRVQFGEVVAYEALVERTAAPPAPTRSGSLLPFLSRSSPPPAPNSSPAASGEKDSANRSKDKSKNKDKAPGLAFLPRGFAQMAVIDLRGFNRQNYQFDYVRREFLGEVRCLVFDVSPKSKDPGRFLGRIWVEDQGFSIVRFNGTYVSAPAAKDSKAASSELYFHFDSWRVNVGSQEWVPAQIYVEEEASSGTANTRFKAQTRVWDYAAAPTNKLDELTQMLIEGENGARDQSSTADASPLESQRAWERQAEENVLARLEKGGLLAPPGPVDEVLNTVVNNLIISAKLTVQAHCRVLLTTPIETFSIGHTIVISRGLIDVLPDETSLALVLADELSHIALSHRTPTNFAFSNQTMMSDAALLQNVHFERTRQELDEAGAKTIEIMRASPYQKTGNAGLFLKALGSRIAALPRLLAANLGNQVADSSALARLSEFTSSAPELEENKLEQISALPLGSRVKLNPSSDQITLIATKPVSLLSAREKMPFEITPFVLYLTRADSGANNGPPKEVP